MVDRHSGQDVPHAGRRRGNIHRLTQPDIGHDGRTITLKSVHPIYESGGKCVATPHILEPLGKIQMNISQPCQVQRDL